MKHFLCLYFLFPFILLFPNGDLSQIEQISRPKYIYLLKLQRESNKCGEWGGDIETIIVYKENINTPLLADYQKAVVNCEVKELQGKDDNPTLFERKNIKLKESDRLLIKNCVKELTISKLIVLDSLKIGITGHNLVVFSDSSLIIEDWLSEWKEFDILRTEILKRK